MTKKGENRMFSLLKLLGIFAISQAKSIYDNHNLTKYMQSPEYIMLKERYDYLYKPLPRMKGYNRVLEFDVAHEKIRDILPLLDKEYIKKNISNGESYGYSVICAENKWLEENEPYFYNRGYRFEHYILEHARKTAYDNGYMPCCQRIGMTRKRMYDTLYSGKIINNNYAIDFIFGRPDQKERERLIEVDKLYKYG